MKTKIKNTGSETKAVIIVTREEVTLEPGEEIEIYGDIEI
jgi:uncharacterized membrane protein